MQPLHPVLVSLVLYKGRTFNRLFVASAAVTTKLKDSKLENRMKEYQNDAAFQLLSSVGQVMEDLQAPQANDRPDTSEIEEEKDET